MEVFRLFSEPDHPDLVKAPLTLAAIHGEQPPEPSTNLGCSKLPSFLHGDPPTWPSLVPLLVRCDEE